MRDIFKMMGFVVEPENVTITFPLGSCKAKIIAYEVDGKYYFVLESFGKLVATWEGKQEVLINASNKRSAEHVQKFCAWIEKHLGINNIKELKI